MSQIQYTDDTFSDSSDCEFCKRIMGMELKCAWLSSVDIGIMNVRFECVSCNRRKWARLALPEVLQNEPNTPGSS